LPDPSRWCGTSRAAKARLWVGPATVLPSFAAESANPGHGLRGAGPC
jgi:hypothetical protein